MALREWDQFTVEIRDNNTIRATWSTHDNQETHRESRVDERESLHEDIADGIRQLRAGSEDLREGDIQKLGQKLYEAIFPEEIGRLFEQALQNVRSERKRGNKNRWLRVIIDVHPRSTVFHWPLEFLYCRAHECWLASERPAIALSRRTIFTGSVDLERQSPPLRVLVIISRPDAPELRGVMAVKVLEEIGKLAVPEPSEEGGAGAPKMDVRVIGKVEDYEKKIPGIDYLDQPACYDVISELSCGQWQPHVFHFVGHGNYDEDKAAGSLALVGKRGGVDWCDADNLSQLFSDWPLRLVLLQACEGALSGTEPGLMSLADHLARCKIPAVVAMQYAITNDYATQFAVGFYEALRDGKDVDAAVQSGRWKIWSASRRGQERDFGAPVLFTYKPDCIIEPLPSGQRPRAACSTSRAVDAAEQTRQMIEDAMGWLGAEGHDVDLGLAQTYLVHAGGQLRQEQRREARGIEDAKRWLEQGQAALARDILLKVRDSLVTSVGVEQSAAQPAPPVSGEQGKPPADSLEPVKAQPEGLPRGATSSEGP
jgi:hypothetical protein